MIHLRKVIRLSSDFKYGSDRAQVVLTRAESRMKVHILLRLINRDAFLGMGNPLSTFMRLSSYNFKAYRQSNSFLVCGLGLDPRGRYALEYR